MRDLIRSALVLDDLSPVWTTNLIAQLTRALDDQDYLAAYGQRRNRAQTFLRSYLNRRMSCLPCHNSKWAVTDDPLPTLDRHWPMNGLHEEALFGASEADDHVPLTPFFRRRGVLSGYYYAKEGVIDDLCPMGMCDDDYPKPPEDLADEMLPWGWAERCGRYFPPDKVRDDDAFENDDVLGHFIEDKDQRASVWDLVFALRAGFDALRVDGLSVADDGTVDGELAFAWMTSANIVDRVWKAAYGSRLTIVNYFPRNQAQHDKLAALTADFAASRYSLIDLLAAVTADPLFNGPAPADGLGDPRSYPPIFDSFVDDSIDISLRRNHVGHLIRRAPAREMLRSVYLAMGWPRTPEFMIYFMSAAARLQRSIGVFHKTADPGFDGIGFQSALAWEATVGVCEDATLDPKCYLAEIFDLPEGQISGTTICELCDEDNIAAACEWDARCCDVDWAAVCTLECGAREKIFLEQFPKPEIIAGPDYITRLVEKAAADGATLRDAAATLKDRLITEPRLSAPNEPALIEALIGASLDSTITDVADAEAGLRKFCGAVVASPGYLLRGLPAPDLLAADGLDTLIRLAGDTDQALCEKLASALFEGGNATCADGVITVQ